MIPQNDFHKGLKAATCFIDPKLPGLHVVHFNFITPDNFEMVATDGHRLVNIEFSAPHSCPPGTRVSVPLAMAEEILTMFPAEGSHEITLAFWDGKLLITNGADTKTVHGPPAGDYPNYQNVVGSVSPQEGEVYLSPRLLSAILKDCGALAARKMADAPVLQITVSGGATVFRLKFRVDPELEVISAVTAYLMPLNAEAAGTTI